MKIYLEKEKFLTQKELLVEGHSLVVNTFKYESKVEAIEVTNGILSFEVLPYDGQQIWNLAYKGKGLSMINKPVKMPLKTHVFGDCYSPFLMHCGFSAMGVPQSDDDHVQHGEITMIDYNSAYVICDKDDSGYFVAVGGNVEVKIEDKHYEFNPEVRLYEGASTIKVNVNLKNLLNIPLEYMYLCHLNFRPFDGAKLIYSADYQKVKPYYLNTCDKRDEYYKILDKDPSLHNQVGNAFECYDPEMCLNVKYKGDSENKAYSLQYEEGVGACYICHPVNYLPEGIRWISRTENTQAMGLVLPATAEHLGRARARRNGQIKVLAPFASLSFTVEAGYLNNEDALKVIKKIEEINE